MFKESLIFVSGLGMGGLVGYLVANKVLDQKYFDKYDEKAKELEEYYQIQSLYERQHEERKKMKEADRPEDESLSKAHGNDIKERPLRNERGATNYTEFFRKSKIDESEDELAEKEHPEDDGPNDEILDPDFERDFDEHSRNLGREPRIISEEVLGELGPTWDEQTLMYYYYDGVTTTEEDEVLDDGAVYDLLGDCLEKYGFSSNEDEMVIYVQNFKLNTVYEVQKVISKYE